MSSQVIFETERLVVRKLQMSDLDPFHEMQSNPKVMQYADGEVKSKEAHTKELKNLIEFYEKVANDFWIYAIDRKLDNAFVGTLALIKDDQGDDEAWHGVPRKLGVIGHGTDC